MEEQVIQKPKSGMLKRLGIVSVIIVAVAIIGVSVFSLVNPNGLEVANDGKQTTVTLSDSGVQPSEIKIAKGDTVMWVNEGQSSKRLVSTSTEQIEGFGGDEALQAGETYSFTFDAKGSFTYEDATQPDIIKGTIIVE